MYPTASSLAWAAFSNDGQPGAWHMIRRKMTARANQALLSAPCKDPAGFFFGAGNGEHLGGLFPRPRVGLLVAGRAPRAEAALVAYAFPRQHPAPHCPTRLARARSRAAAAASRLSPLIINCAAIRAADRCSPAQQRRQSSFSFRSSRSAVRIACAPKNLLFLFHLGRYCRRQDL
ncbi:hypothetical protein BDY21DRAFT_123901 [Lineolata rhizophorae]|uniref:Uncharacterized protein n=1 Tax=Lineolata rhizophorae TaxID=578093 RepID=A0A6A6NQU7_9PEZI|nr:hypothetical protein BDY21DRAFT_123901 [Lineolata rhizophorae]